MVLCTLHVVAGSIYDLEDSRSDDDEKEETEDQWLNFKLIAFFGEGALDFSSFVDVAGVDLALKSGSLVVGHFDEGIS